jgi:hypothetical protein
LGHFPKLSNSHNRVAASARICKIRPQLFVRKERNIEKVSLVVFHTRRFTTPGGGAPVLKAQWRRALPFSCARRRLSGGPPRIAGKKGLGVLLLFSAAVALVATAPKTMPGHEVREPTPVVTDARARRDETHTRRIHHQPRHRQRRAAKQFGSRERPPPDFAAGRHWNSMSSPSALAGESWCDSKGRRRIVYRGELLARRMRLHYGSTAGSRAPVRISRGSPEIAVDRRLLAGERGI